MVEETRSTLKFAYNAKRIKLRPQVNEVVDDKVLIENLKKELSNTKLKLQNLKEFQEKNPPAPQPTGDDDFPMIDKFFAKMNMYMNASVRSEDFVDALEEMSGLTMGSAGCGGGDIAQPGGEGAAADPAVEEDEDDVEAFRRQILAKFMNEMEDEEGDNGEAADTTMGDTNANNTTVGDTTLNSTTGGGTTDVDTSVNRTGMTNDTAAKRGTQDASGRQHAAPSSPRKVTPQQEGLRHAPAGPPEISRHLPAASKPALLFAEDPQPEPPHDSADQVKRSFIDSDESSNSTPQLPPNESDLNLIERFRAEILEKFRDEIVDEEAAHELDENAQNVAVIANELINKFKREIVYKYKDEFPELLVKRMEVDLAATPVGDNGIVGRVIERAAVDDSPASPVMNTSDDSSVNGSVERFEDEFDESAKLGKAAERGKQEAKQADEGKPFERNVPGRTYSTQTTGAVINGRPPFGLGGTGLNSNKPDPPIPPITSAPGKSASGSVSSDLSSDVADKKAGSAMSPLPANPPDEKDGLIPPGEIAIGNGDGEPGAMEGKMRIIFLEEKLLATDELVETLFVELENAKGFIRELVFENAGGGGGGLDPSGAALFGSAGTSGVTVVDEQILNQCEILKFAIYTSLLFFVFGQHELFLATVFFLWLSLEVATKT